MKTLVKYLFIFGLAFLVSGFIAYNGLKMFTKSAGEIVLPELRGKNIIYVLETLTNMGLNAKLNGTAFDDAQPKYAVIQQDPLPGTTIKKGRDVLLLISKGKKQSVIPDLRQIPLKQATILLEKNEFQTGHISKIYSETTPKDRIISQVPEPFANADKGSTCDLLVSIGRAPANRVMPDLSGMELSRASAILNQNQLPVSNIRSDSDPNRPYGMVLSQIPLPGSYARESTRVTLVVNGPGKDLQMDPVSLSKTVLLSHTLAPGFLKQHVRVETNRLGPILTLYDELMEPGKTFFIWIPTDKETDVYIYINTVLVRTVTINPWEKDSLTGDQTWQSSPLQFYPPISQSLEQSWPQLNPQEPTGSTSM